MVVFCNPSTGEVKEDEPKFQTGPGYVARFGQVAGEPGLRSETLPQRMKN